MLLFSSSQRNLNRRAAIEPGLIRSYILYFLDELTKADEGLFCPMKCTIRHDGEVSHGNRSVRQLVTLNLHPGNREQQMLVFSSLSLLTHCVNPLTHGMHHSRLACVFLPLLIKSRSSFIDMARSLFPWWL